jgi:cysteine-rich repeat protein
VGGAGSGGRSAGGRSSTGGTGGTGGVGGDTGGVDGGTGGTGGTPLEPVCGDGLVQAGEACDDGNTEDDDGCTERCEPPFCGDDLLTAGEQCDDGGADDDDGCSKACRIEIVGLELGASTSCALRADGAVKCWGDNTYGQLGLGETAPRGDEPGEMGDNLPTVDLGRGRSAQALAAGTGYVCALLDDGSVKCWGQNGGGQLGLGDTEARGDEPGEMGDALPTVRLGTGRKARFLAAGFNHTCAGLDDGSSKCWGSNGTGQLGLGDTNARGWRLGQMGDSLDTVDLGTGRSAQSLHGGEVHTCALLDDDSVKCWGLSLFGGVGTGLKERYGDTPGEMGDALPTVDLGGMRTAQALAASEFGNCALLDDGSVKCWGFGNWGSLGLGDQEDRGDDPGEMGDDLPPVDLGTGRSVRLLAAGYGHACAVLDDGTLKCWGQNGAGALGLGDKDNRGGFPGQMGDDLPPVDLGAGRSARALAAGGARTCVLLDGVTVKCWGANSSGALGLGDEEHRGDDPGEMGDSLPSIDL